MRRALPVKRVVADPEPLGALLLASHASLRDDYAVGGARVHA